jgi:GMP synthase-like glutamine amidotransferase
MSKPVLLIQHSPFEHPAAVKRALDSQCLKTLWLHPYRGDSLPSAHETSGIISFGGPMGANDDGEHPWISDECRLLREAVDLEIPLVGICLGAQILARALGAEVIRAPQAEVGWHKIELTTEGTSDRILGPIGSGALVYQWHYDTFFLPKAATLLAQSDACPRQAYRLHDKAYAFQFHPEADHQLVGEWLAGNGVETEIQNCISIYGETTVQPIEVQKNNAAVGEVSNLRITTAITQLFNQQSYNPQNKSLEDSLNSWAAHQTVLCLEIDHILGALQLKGTISTLLHLADGSFLIFKEESGLLWPIRLDYVKKIMLG